MTHDLPAYTVTRKRVKHLRLSVKAPTGEVSVSAPVHISDKAIRDFVQSKARWIAKHQERIGRMPEPLEAGPEAERLRREMKAAVPGLLAYWVERMGVPMPSFTIRRMTSRWGTCNIHAKRITLNLELARREPELLEYVIVHELAHLIERGHNDRFYAVMDQAMPDWKAKRAQLNGR